jgi:predicted Na+-dependent transporter
MTQEVLSFTGLVIYLGSVFFLLGIGFQSVVLYRNKSPWLISLLLIIISRLVTFAATLLIWMNWPFSFDIMFGVLLLPALFPETLFSPLILKIAGLNLLKRKIEK